MPLTHTKDLFAKALKGKYALGAFNVNNMELIQAIVEACEEEKAPLMLQISKGARQYANPVYLKKLIEAAVSLSNIPIAIHLDHGDTFELCKECIDEGFTSVMIDASHECFEKNVEITKKVVDYAHKHNCVVEGELGMLVGAQHDDGEEGGHYSKGGCYTHPQEAVDFVRQSGVDSLAVAIGPEGGWSEGERALFAEHGARTLALGVRVLRAETAAMAAVAVLASTTSRAQQTSI